MIRLATAWHALTLATSRRGLLAATSGGLLTALQLSEGGPTSAAKKQRNRKGKGKRKKRRKTPGRTDVRVDAICPGPTDGGGFLLSEGSLFAQTFTALSSGRLELAELLIEANTTGSADLTLQLRVVAGSGVPSNEVLAEASLDVSNVPIGVSAVYFSFADPPPVATNREYALILSRRGSRGISWKSHLGDTCDGRMFRRDPGSELFEVPIDGLDLIFTAIVSS